MFGRSGAGKLCMKSVPIFGRMVTSLAYSVPNILAYSVPNMRAEATMSRATYKLQKSLEFSVAVQAI